MRKAAALVLALTASLAVAFVPSVSQACPHADGQDLYIVSSAVSTSVLPVNPTNAYGQNLRGSCPSTLPAGLGQVDSGVRYNYISPGATVLRVIARSFPDDRDYPPYALSGSTGCSQTSRSTSGTGTIQFDSKAAQSISWTWDQSMVDPRRAWASKEFSIPAGTKKITVSACLKGAEALDPVRRITKVYEVLV